jgi:hypothetical protein
MKLYEFKPKISDFKFAAHWPFRVRQTMAMRLARSAAIAAFLAALLSLAFASFAQNRQSPETFKSRLSPVPINISMMSTVAGTGSLTATLQGKQLTIQGSFEGLRSPATTVQIHRGPKGIPGPAILDLTATNATKGTVTGTLDLTPDQIADLRNGRLYVQIQSERAPDGNLWGWLLP